MTLFCWHLQTRTPSSKSSSEVYHFPQRWTIKKEASRSVTFLGDSTKYTYSGTMNFFLIFLLPGLPRAIFMNRTRTYYSFSRSIFLYNSPFRDIAPWIFRGIIYLIFLASGRVLLILSAASRTHLMLAPPIRISEYISPCQRILTQCVALIRYASKKYASIVR